MFRYVGYEKSNVGAELGIEDRGQQGIITVKRSGTSQNIGPAARKAAGWREVRRIHELAELFAPPPKYAAHWWKRQPAIVIRENGKVVRNASLARISAFLIPTRATVDRSAAHQRGRASEPPPLPYWLNTNCHTSSTFASHSGSG